MHHRAFYAGRRGKGGSSTRHLQSLELVLFELERVLVNGNDRIELFAGGALTRDKPAFLGALDHERRVELALFGTPVDLPERVRRRWVNGSCERLVLTSGGGCRDGVRLLQVPRPAATLDL